MGDNNNDNNNNNDTPLIERFSLNNNDNRKPHRSDG